jgi:hypothetical protein
MYRPVFFIDNAYAIRPELLVGGHEETIPPFLASLPAALRDLLASP